MRMNVILLRPCIAFAAWPVVAWSMASVGGREAQAADPPPSVADATTMKLLKALDDRRMPDVTLWVLDRVATDASAGEALKKEVAFRRAAALVGVTQSESDAVKRAALLDDAQKSIDAFLALNPPLDRRIDALIQKGSLLIARGRMNLDKARQPGAEAEPLRAAAVPFFDQAIAVLKGTSPGKDAPITNLGNAEDAVLKAHRDVDASLKAASARDATAAEEESGEKEGKDAKAAKRRPPAARPDMRAIAKMEEERETLRGQLLQVRLMVADAYFDKSQALPPQSPQRKQAIDESTSRYAELFKKYPTRGAGLLARCNEGRNYAAGGDCTKALAALADMLSMEGSGELVATIRAKALNTSLECWLASKRHDALTDDLLKIALASLPDDRLDAEMLGMKYRAALMLQRRAAGIPEAEKAKRNPLQRNARKLAIEVAKASRDFANDARALLGELGTDFNDVSDTDASFASLMDQARLSLTTMQEKQVVARKAAAAGNDAEKGSADTAAAEARDQATALVSRALAKSRGEPIETVNQARNVLTYLLYEAGRWHEAATIGSFLADRYPSGRGSSQAAMIAMAAWQQLQKQQSQTPEIDPAIVANTREKCTAAAEAIVRGWPDTKEAGDAAVVAIAAAVDAHDAGRMVALLDVLPKQVPRRSEMLLRAGMGLAREIQDAKRRDTAERAGDDVLATWRSRAVSALDEGLSLIPQGAPATAVTIAAALARCQLAMEDGAVDVVTKVLEHPAYGPWTAVTGRMPPDVPESVVGNTLTLALRHFIGTEQVPKAEQAMNLLEKQAGSGEAAAAKLTSMYLAMGRDLQEQLQALAAAGGAAAPQRAAALLAGFETFLQRVSERDDRIASQMWVASTYDSLGSGKDAGAVVPKAKASTFLDKAAKVYERLLGERAKELGPYEPGLRLKIAGMYQQRQAWDKAREHVDWFLSDAGRQNMIDAQIMAAGLAQAAGEAAADAQESARLFREAISGGKRGTSVSWGWGGIANKLVRRAFSGSDERAERAQEQFFDARLNVAQCRLAWAGRDAANRDKLLEMATNDIAVTYKLYPGLGGDAMRRRFDALLREVQKARGEKPDGLTAIEAALAAEPAGAGT